MDYTDEELFARMEFNGWQMAIGKTDHPHGHPRFPWTGWYHAGDGGSTGLPCRDEPVKSWRGTYPNREEYLEDISFAARAREMVGHEDRCEECTRWIEYGRMFGYEREKAGTGEIRFCWHCKGWLERIQLASAEPRKRFVANTDEFYSIGPAATPRGSNGFGGRWWTVTWPDGTTRKTCDLWYGGKAPLRFWDRLSPFLATLEAA